MIKRTKHMTMTAALAALLLLVTAQFCAARTWTVTSTADNDEGTLRAALAAAHNGDIIVFSLSLPATINLESETLLVDKNISILGPGSDNLTITANGSEERLRQVFAVVDYDEKNNSINPDLTVTISDLTIANGFTDAGGGGILNTGILTLRDCVLTNNFCREGGGAIYSIGKLLITNCILSDNRTGTPTPGIYEEGADFFGGGAILIRPIEGLPLDASLTVDRCLITNNSAVKGGGISIFLMTGNQVDATIINSTLSGNGWDGIFGGGGGISVQAFEKGIANVTVEGSTLNGNHIASGEGGAIYNCAAGTASGTGGTIKVKLRNSTLSGNGVSAGYGGGAIVNEVGNEGSATVSVDNCTLSDNGSNAGTYYGNVGIVAFSGQGSNITNVVELKNTILNASPSGKNLLVMVREEADGEVDIISHGNNLSSDGGDGFLTMEGDQINTDPMLDQLADNGGSTWTHALQENSPAIDAGSPTDIIGNSITMDQRGVKRPQGENNDIGAFELEVSEFDFEWSGVMLPINPDGTSVFKAGSTVPVKFMLTGSSAGITDLEATLSYIMIGNGSPGDVNESVSISAATTGNLFRYDDGSGEYIFNWSTKGLTQGSYRLYIDLGDGVERFVDVGLK